MVARQLQKDTGWAWLVMFVSVVNQIFTLGFSFVISIYYMPWLESFHESRSLTAWVGSINTGMLYFIGPIATMTIVRFGTRKTVMGANALAAFGMAVGSQSPNIYVLILTCGILSGAAMGISFVAGFAIVGEYFHKWRHLAFAVTSVGVGVAPLLLAPLQQLLINAYTWRGAMLVSAGLLLNGCVVGAVMRDPPHAAAPSSSSPPPRGVAASVCDMELFRDPCFYLLCLCNFLHGFGNSPVLVLFCDHLATQGYGANDVAWLFSLWGVMNTIGRPLAGAVCQLKSLRNSSVYLFYAAVMLSGGFALLIGSTGQSHAFYVASICGYGFFFGATFGNWGNVMLDLFGQSKLVAVTGWSLVSMGTSYFIGAPVGGHLADLQGTFSVAFYMGGAVTVAAGLTMVFVPILLTDKIRPHTKQQMFTKRYLNESNGGRLDESSTSMRQWVVNVDGHMVSEACTEEFLRGGSAL
ncbi:PREDICTED: monocarboxylate transporter 3-like [Priapulus caudatus]|uniref:Monocarboxylate transporter 3-like n=1 Tax=Priapulus caudatus TaxID=37621 RepID=A0ABM1F2N1_PRICU|nr:PREDICTED: monocarboxylate transporter 3-like [Priapulus caudatus]XP_014678702.1 PREDICTED: monocarboxylate transporter 3-like [Priapulus caudatus]